MADDVDSDQHCLGDLAREWLRHQLHRSGIIRTQATLDHSLTAAVIADLYLSGRIAGDNALQVDVSDARDLAVNLVLSFVDRHPWSTLDELLAHGPSLVGAVAQTLVDQGTWRRQDDRRYREQDRHSIRLPTRRDVAALLFEGVPGCSFDTSLAVLLRPTRGVGGDVFARCSSAGHFLRSYIDCHGTVPARTPGWSDLFTDLAWWSS